MDFDDTDLDMDEGVMFGTFQWFKVVCSCACFVKSTTTEQLHGTICSTPLDTYAQFSSIRGRVWLELPSSIREDSRLITDQSAMLHGAGGGSASVVDIASFVF